MKKILYIFAFAALLTACTNDGINDIVKVPVEGQDAIVADIDNEGELRNSLVDEDGKRYIVWTIEDTIGVNSTEGKIDDVSSTNSPAVVDEEQVGTSTATFWFGKGTIAGDILFAYYPYSYSAKVVGTTLTTTLTSSQPYSTESLFAPDVTIMTAVPNSEGKLVFKNTCSILQFKIKGTQCLTSISLKSAAHCLAGEGVVDGSVAVPTFVVNPNTEAAKKLITLDFNNQGVQLSADVATAFNFVVPAGTYNDLTISARTVEGEIIERDITQPCTVEPRHIAPFAPFTLGELMIENAVDLAADGVSNCYMISAAKGGRYYLEPKNIAGDIKAEDVANIDILWGDIENIIGNTYYDAEAKRYYFTTHGGNHNGSVILSAFNDKGKVLWSWHIWVSDAEVQELSSQNIKMLDRNIGARYAPKSAADVAAMSSSVAASTCGFYYQYGRAIPFPGPKTMDSWYESVDSSVTNQYGYETVAFDTNTMAYVNDAHGMKFENGFFEDASHTVASSAASPMTLWHGNTAAYLQTWAADIPKRQSGGDEKTWCLAKKGHQDPCPQGYRINSFEELLSCFREHGLTSDNWIKYSHYCVSSKKVVVATSTPLDNYGGYHSGVETNNYFIWLPHAGVRVSYLPNNYSYSESAKPSDRTETGKLYLTSFYNNKGTLKSANYYGTGIVEGSYTMGTNVINVWGNTSCPLDSCNPFMIMTGSANAYARTSGSTYYSMPTAMGVPMRCVKMEDTTSNE